MKKEQKIIIISGPTASGKSSLAVQWAKQYGGAVINADALQIYDSLPILSAQPSLAEKNDVLHYLYGELNHQQQCSVVTWLELAKEKILSCFSQNLLPIVVGGTGMYLSALLDGLNFIPEIEQKFIQQAEDLYLQLGRKIFIHQFVGDDSNIIDKQKLIRYASVYLQTNQKMDFWHSQPKIKAFPQAEFLHYTIKLPREQLYENCNLRFRKMIEQDAILEVAKALPNLDKSNSSVKKTIGFAEISQYLQGEISLESACNLASQKTRNYAKRQLTWINNRFSTAVVI